MACSSSWFSSRQCLARAMVLEMITATQKFFDKHAAKLIKAVQGFSFK